VSAPIDQERARQLLRHTWHAFFGRFGSLTGAQAAAIEPVANGESVVLCAATASGKTEALLGPMIEHCIQRDRRAGQSSSGQSNSGGLRVIVVCPTRALCNDFLRRVRRPVQASNWTIDLKSGDNPSFSAEKPPDLLITTPESLDSLLSRKPAALQHVDALFLDEVHLLDGTPRGDHLRALVSRLKSFRADLQICCASATAADATRLGAEFAGTSAQGKPATVVKVEGGRDRKIEAALEHVVELDDAARAIVRLARDDPGSKLLVFANTRAEVEWLASTLASSETTNAGGLKTFAHHGSLSKSERLRTEKGFLNAKGGVCIATMTLELGIDIGDVDRAVLLNPPPNVASFTQRIGRSNRRSKPGQNNSKIQVSCLYSSGFDRIRFEHMIACAEAGKLFVEPTAFRPTILPQQAVSLMFQNPKGWVSAGALHARLPTDVAQQFTEADCRAVLDVMRTAGYLHADSHGRFVADDPAKKEYRYGRMHAHIGGDSEIEVVDETTGRAIGTARWSSEDQGRADADGPTGMPLGGMLLGGKQRKVTRTRDNQVFVESSDLDEAPQFVTRMGPRYSFALARDLARFAGLADDELGLVPIESMASGRRQWRLEHHFGTLWGRLVAAVMRQKGFTLVGVGAFHATARFGRGKLPESLGTASQIKAAVDDFLTEGYRELRKPLQPGPWQRFVPDELMRRWVRECVRPAEFSEVLARFRLVEVFSG
jgi:ATP-dependent Lhr-like helicase